jgi:hypothetical protein
LSYIEGYIYFTHASYDQLARLTILITMHFLIWPGDVFLGIILIAAYCYVHPTLVGQQPATGGSSAKNARALQREHGTHSLLNGLEFEDDLIYSGQCYLL